MPSSGVPVDILLITALKEERFLVQKWWEESLFIVEDPEIEGIEEAKLRITNVKGHTVGLATLMGMGNIWAVADTLRLVERIWPKCVLLVGVAAGTPGIFECGDVGYSEMLVYSTFGKVEEITVRNKLREFNNQGSLELVKRILEFPKRESKAQENALSQIIDAMRLKNLQHDNQGRKAAKQLLRSMQRKVGPLWDWIMELKLPRPEVRLQRDEHKEAWRAFVRCAEKTAGDGKWKDHATKWFNNNKYKDEFVKFVSDTHREYYPEDQKEFSKKGPNARNAVVASGEFVIASEVFRKAIEYSFARGSEKRRNKIPKEVGMFDMESYGVANACHLVNVEFGMVKGIADDGSAGKDNEYRYAAQASAWAFVRSLIEDSDLLSHTKKLEYPNGRLAEACLLCEESKVFPCLYEPSLKPVDAAHSIRSCTRFDKQQLSDQNQIRACRVFENVDGKTYSGILEKELEKDGTRAFFIFPYSPVEVLLYIKKEMPKLGQAVDEIIHNASHKNKEEKLVAKTISICRKARPFYPHFVKSDMICMKLIAEGRHFHEIAQRICRVIIIRDFKEDNNRKELTDKLMVVYPAFLGVCVPTMIISGPSIKFPREEEIVIGTDEITCLRIDPDEKHGPTRLMVFKHLDGSNSLVFLGRCTRDDCGVPFEFMKDRKTFSSIERVLKKLASAIKNDKARENLEDTLPHFPFSCLLKAYKRNVESLYDAGSLEATTPQAIEDYLKKVDTREYWSKDTT